jgi:tetratricopeptide (TPR) repeat protein
MNFSGNYLLASCLFRTIEKLLPERIHSALQSGGEPIDEAQCASRLAFGPWSRLKTAQFIRRMLYGPPFDQQFDVEDAGRRWDARIAALEAELSAAGVTSPLVLHEQTLARVPDDWMTRKNFAGLLFDSGYLLAASQQYQQVVRQVRYCYDAHLQLGKLALAQRDPSSAIGHFQRALKLVPDLHPAQHELAKALAALGKYDEALAIVQRQVEIEPDRTEAVALLADFLIGQGKFAEAQKTLDAGLRDAPQNASLHIVLGNLHLERSDRDGAVAQYELAMRLRPTETPRLAEFLKKLKENQGPAAP